VPSLSPGLQDNFADGLSRFYAAMAIGYLSNLLLSFYPLKVEALTKLLYSPTSIHEPLLPREKGMAIRADFNREGRFDAQYLKGCCACAAYNSSFSILWMNTFFHHSFLHD